MIYYFSNVLLQRRTSDKICCKLPNDDFMTKNIFHNDKVLALDIETTGIDPFTNKILLISLSNGTDTCVIDCRNDITFPFDNYSYILHNAKFDYKFLKVNGHNINIYYDTMIAEQRITQGLELKHGLKPLLKRRLKIDHDKTVRDEFNQDIEIKERHILYSARDVEYLHAIMHIHEDFIKRYDLKRAVENEIKLIKILADAELFGITLDENKWKENIERNKKEIKKLKPILDKNIEEIFDIKIKERKFGIRTQFSLFGPDVIEEIESGEINYNSSIQLKKLFLKRKVKKIPTQEGKVSFSKKASIEFINNFPEEKTVPFLRNLIKLREYEKRLNSFGEDFLAFKNPVTNKIHTIFKQCNTKNNRLASGNTKQNNPNIQQIPREKNYRKCFLASSEDRNILTIDLSGAELIILAALSQDPFLLENCKGDLHSIISTRIWKKLLNDENYMVSKETNTEKRQNFKNTIYAWLYGAGKNTIARLLDIPVSSVDVALKELEGTIPIAANFLKEVAHNAVKNNFIVFNKATNSRSWFNNVPEDEVRRNSMNYIISGTQADIIKEAMVKVNEFITENNIDAKLLFQVHDELVYDFHERHTDFPERVREILTNTSQDILKSMSIDSEYHVEKHWSK